MARRFGFIPSGQTPSLPRPLDFGDKPTDEAFLYNQIFQKFKRFLKIFPVVRNIRQMTELLEVSDRVTNMTNATHDLIRDLFIPGFAVRP